MNKFIYVAIISIAAITSTTLSTVTPAHSATNECYYTQEDLKNQLQKSNFDFDNSKRPANAMALLPRFMANSCPDFYNQDNASLLTLFKVQAKPRTYAGGQKIKTLSPQISSFKVTPDIIRLGETAEVTFSFQDKDSNVTYYALTAQDAKGGNFDLKTSTMLGTARVGEKVSHIFFPNLPAEAKITLYGRDFEGNTVSKEAAISIMER